MIVMAISFLAIETAQIFQDLLQYSIANESKGETIKATNRGYSLSP